MKLRERASLFLATALTAVMVVGTLASPASAHWKRSVGHLLNHAKAVFYTKSQVYTKGQADARYSFFCQGDPTTLIAQAYVDDSDLATPSNFTSYPLGGGCVTDLLIRNASPGVYEIALPPLSEDTFDDDLFMVQVTGVGQDVQTSYQFAGVSGQGTVIQVYRREGATHNLADGDFSIAVTGWIPDAAIVATREAENGLAIQRGELVPDR